MAADFDGRAVRFDDLPSELINADIVISCTAANHYVLRVDNCQEVLLSRQGRTPGPLPDERRVQSAGCGNGKALSD